MKPLLTKAGKLLQEQSRNREAVIRLNRLDEPTDEQRAELTTATDRLEAIEPEIRAAMTAEAAERAELEAEARQMPRWDSGMDAETRERNDPGRKASVGNFLSAFLGGGAVTGVEAELRAAYPECMDGEIPVAALETAWRDERHAETRAITPAPAANTGVNLESLQPFVYAASIGSRLGIEMRDVPSGTYAVPTVTTAPAGGAAPVAKDADADATAGAITINSGGNPRRIPARLSVRLEDVSAFGNDTFEAGLRQALQGQLGAGFDNQILNGDGNAPNLSGLLNQLGDPAAPAAAVETFDRWAAIGASAIDGLWAMSQRDIFQVWNVDAFKQASGVFRGADGPVSAASYLARELSGFAAHSRMPATAAHIATGIAARLAQPGLMRAVIGNYGRMTVDDIYSDSGKGQRHFTISLIVSDLILVQSAAYVQLAARVSV